MSVTELLQSARFVVDADGNKKAVMVDYDVWEELLTILEDWEDAQEIKQLRVLKEEAMPWGQAKEELKDKGIDV
jgi:hypothetical protein